MVRGSYPTIPTRSLAADLGRSVGSVRQRAAKLGIEKVGHPGYVFPDRLRRYSVNGAAFDVLRPTTAYVLGFVLADGNIRTRPSCRLKIANTDRRILEQMASILEATAPIARIEKGTAGIYELLVINKQLVQGLLAVGITPRKSLTANLPTVPDSVFGDFLRGYFDGDGHVNSDTRHGLRLKFTSGSRALLEQLAERLTALYGVRPRIVAADKGRPNALRLWYYGQEARRLAVEMYRNAGDLCMARKRLIFSL